MRGRPEHIPALRPCTLLARFHSRFCELQENTREGAEAHLVEHIVAIEILRTTDPPTQHRHVLAHLQRVTDSTDRGGCVGCANVARMGPSFDAPRKQDIVNHSRVHATTPRGSTVEWRARAGHEITHTVAALVSLVVSQQFHPFVDPPHMHKQTHGSSERTSGCVKGKLTQKQQQTKRNSQYLERITAGMKQKARNTNCPIKNDSVVRG